MGLSFSGISPTWLCCNSVEWGGGEGRDGVTSLLSSRLDE